MSNVLSKIKSLFKKKKEDWPWEEPEAKQDETSIRFFLQNTLGSLRKTLGNAAKAPERHHLGIMRKIKRTLAFTLFIFYGMASFALFPNPISILFLVSCYLMLDLLWNTRYVKWVEK